MGRVKHLGRTGQFFPALKHILQKDPTFKYTLEDYEKIEKTRVYDPCRGTTSPEFNELCKAINTWLVEHYDMFELDYTNFYDEGSREEVILCYTKRNELFDHPDFATELPQVVFYR